MVTMKLKDIKTWVTVPPSGIGGSFWVIVKLTTDNGIEGIGEGIAKLGLFDPVVTANDIQRVLGSIVRKHAVFHSDIRFVEGDRAGKQPIPLARSCQVFEVDVPQQGPPASLDDKQTLAEFFRGGCGIDITCFRGRRRDHDGIGFRPRESDLRM